MSESNRNSIIELQGIVDNFGNKLNLLKKNASMILDINNRLGQLENDFKSWKSMFQKQQMIDTERITKLEVKNNPSYLKGDSFFSYPDCGKDLTDIFKLVQNQLKKKIVADLKAKSEYLTNHMYEMKYDPDLKEEMKKVFIELIEKWQPRVEK